LLNVAPTTHYVSRIHIDALLHSQLTDCTDVALAGRPRRDAIKANQIRHIIDVRTVLGMIEQSRCQSIVSVSRRIKSELHLCDFLCIRSITCCTTLSCIQEIRNTSKVYRK